MPRRDLNAEERQRVLLESQRIWVLAIDLVYNAGHNQAALARYLGESADYVSRLKSGQNTRDMVIGLETLRKVEDFVQRTPGHILRLAGYVSSSERSQDALRPFFEAARAGGIHLPPDLEEMLRAIVENAALEDRED